MESWKIKMSARLFWMGFGRREKDGHMRRNETVTPSFCPSLVFSFANMFFHMMLACMDCFVNCVTAC